MDKSEDWENSFVMVDLASDERQESPKRNGVKLPREMPHITNGFDAVRVNGTAPEATSPFGATAVGDEPVELFADTRVENEVKDDGTRVKRTITTTRHVIWIREIVIVEGEEVSTKRTEKLVGVEVDEDVVEVRPEVLDESQNVFVKTAEHRSDDILPDGTWLRRRTILRTIVPTSLQKDAVHVGDTNIPDVLSDKYRPAVSEMAVYDTLDLREDIKEENYVKDDGTKVRKYISEIRHINVSRRVKRDQGSVAMNSGSDTEKLIGIEIDEDVLEVSADVTDVCAADVSSKTTVTTEEDIIQPEDIWRKRKLRLTVVERATKKIDEVKQDSVEFQKNVRNENFVRPDGTILRKTLTEVRHLAKDSVPLEGDADITLKVLLGTEVEEAIVEISPAVNVDTRNINSTTTTTVDKDVYQSDGSWLRRKVHLTVIQPATTVLDTPDYTHSSEPGTVQLQTNVKQESHEKPDGTKVQRNITEILHIARLKNPHKPELEQATMSSKSANDDETNEVLLGTEILEDVVEISPAVKGDMKNVHSTTTVKEENEISQSNGSWVCRRIRLTVMQLAMTATAEQLQHDLVTESIPVYPLEHIGDFRLQNTIPSGPEIHMPATTIASDKDQLVELNKANEFLEQKILPEQEIVSDAKLTNMSPWLESVSLDKSGELPYTALGETVPFVYVSETVNKPAIDEVVPLQSIMEPKMGTELLHTTANEIVLASVLPYVDLETSGLFDSTSEKVQVMLKPSTEVPTSPDSIFLERTIETTGGTVEAFTVKNIEEELRDGAHVRQIISTTTHIQHFTDVTRVDGTVVESKNRDEIIGIEIDEDCIESATGVLDRIEGQDGVHKTTETEQNEILPNGAWKKTKIRRTLVEPIIVSASSVTTKTPSLDDTYLKNEATRILEDSSDQKSSMTSEQSYTLPSERVVKQFRTTGMDEELYEHKPLESVSCPQGTSHDQDTKTQEKAINVPTNNMSVEAFGLTIKSSEIKSTEETQEDSPALTHQRTEIESVVDSVPSETLIDERLLRSPAGVDDTHLFVNVNYQHAMSAEGTQLIKPEHSKQTEVSIETPGESIQSAGESIQGKEPKEIKLHLEIEKVSHAVSDRDRLFDSPATLEQMAIERNRRESSSPDDEFVILEVPLESFHATEDETIEDTKQLSENLAQMSSTLTELLDTSCQAEPTIQTTITNTEFERRTPDTDKAFEDDFDVIGISEQELDLPQRLSYDAVSTSDEVEANAIGVLLTGPGDNQQTGHDMELSSEELDSFIIVDDEPIDDSLGSYKETELSKMPSTSLHYLDDVIQMEQDPDQTDNLLESQTLRIPKSEESVRKDTIGQSEQTSEQLDRREIMTSQGESENIVSHVRPSITEHAAPELDATQEPAEAAAKFTEGVTITEPTEGVYEPTKGVSEPTKVVEPTERVTEVTKVVEPTEGITEPTEGAIEPTKVLEPTEIITEPTKVAESTEIVIELTKVGEPTEGVTESAKAVEPTGVITEPTKVVEPTEVITEPTKVVEVDTEFTEVVEPAEQVTEPSKAVELAKGEIEFTKAEIHRVIKTESATTLPLNVVQQEDTERNANELAITTPARDEIRVATFDSQTIYADETVTESSSLSVSQKPSAEDIGVAAISDSDLARTPTEKSKFVIVPEYTDLSEKEVSVNDEDDVLLVSSKTVGTIEIAPTSQVVASTEFPSSNPDESTLAHTRLPSESLWESPLLPGEILQKGVLIPNQTDSYPDGGKFVEPDQSIAQLEDSKPDVLDIVLAKEVIEHSSVAGRKTSPTFDTQTDNEELQSEEPQNVLKYLTTPAMPIVAALNEMDDYDNGLEEFATDLSKLLISDSLDLFKDQDSITMFQAQLDVVEVRSVLFVILNSVFISIDEFV